MARRYPKRPVVAVGALVVKEGFLLLARRGKEPYVGKWSLPGGVVRTGEGLKEAVKRELKEECGVEVEIENASEVVERLVRDEEGRIQYHYVIIDYLATWRGGEVKASSDLLEARWVNVSDLHRYELTDGTLEVIERLLARVGKGSMVVSVNGKPREVEEGWSIAKLLETLQLNPLRVAVVLNQEIVKRQHYGATFLKEGDKVEIVTIMAGGGRDDRDQR